MAGKRNNELTETIFEFIYRYADEKNGPTPTIWEISVSLKLPYSTVYYHVGKLERRHLIMIEDNKIVVVGSEWIGPERQLSLFQQSYSK
jgi:predicted transcriptional regulator